MAARPALAGVGLLLAAGCLAAALPSLAGPFAFATGWRSPTLRPRDQRPLLGLRARPPVPKSELEFKTNEQIRFTEVRVVAELSEGANATMVDCNEVMLTKDALAKAKSRGLDLVLVNDGRDPPLVKIVNVGKYTYMEKKREKQQQRQGKQPKVKEVKLTRTVGDHDLNTKLNQIEKWLQNKRQQVRITVQLKGRSRAFQQQARELLQRIMIEVSGYAKAAGGAKNKDIISKDGSGNLYIMLNAGKDASILKMLKEERAAEEDEEEEEEEERPAQRAKRAAEGPTSQELEELQAELEEVKQDLLDCGIVPGQLSKQPEFVDVTQRIEEEKAKLAGKAFGAMAGRGAAAAGALRAASFALAAASLAAVLRRPGAAQAARRRSGRW